MISDQFTSSQTDDNSPKFPHDLSSLHRFDPHKLIYQWFESFRPDPSLPHNSYWGFLVEGVEIMRYILHNLQIEFCIMESLIEYIFENPQKYRARFADFPSPSFLLQESLDGKLVIHELLDKMDQEWPKCRYVIPE